MKIILLVHLSFILSITGFPQDARKIVEDAKNAVEIESMEMLATLKIIDPKGRERIRQTSTATNKFGETTKTIIKFISPADVKGTSMLIYDYENKDDDMWIFMPALRKTRRIISSEKSKSFMGSEFTNADMSAPNIEDFKYNLIGTKSLNDNNCWVIESVCKNEDIEDTYGFSRKISYIDETNTLVQKVEYYDFDNQLQKVLFIDNYKKQPNNKYFAFSMKMENQQNGRSSIMQIDKFQLGSTLAESHFAPAMLR